MAAAQPTPTEIRVGQEWTLGGGYGSTMYPRRLRVVCRYPFAHAVGEPLWVVEVVGTFVHLMRLSEPAVRKIYELAEDVASN